MFKRLAAEQLQRLARQFPAVAVLGARQVGKTTLSRQTFSGARYVDLESADTRWKYEQDAHFHLTEGVSASTPTILDEAQLVPGLFAELRGLIDADRKRNGQFILLGSANPQLIRAVSESLAGRIGVVELDPFAVCEVEERFSWREVWLRGGMPDALQGNFRDWWEAYLRTYIERDLARLGVDTDPLLMLRLLRMLAHQQGGLLNASELGRSLGISYHTINRYIDILEQTYLVRRLPPYFRNVGRRLVKAPKCYLRDTGLLHHLLNLNTLDDVRNHPVLGASWETFVLEDLMRREKLAGRFTEFYFWRTATGQEADLLFERGGCGETAVEVKVGGIAADAVRQLDEIRRGLKLKSVAIVNQASGTEKLQAGIVRVGAPEIFHWLP
jgi:uncharacterized protein